MNNLFNNNKSSNQKSGKLQISELKLKSFVTNLEEADQAKLKAGRGGILFSLDDTHPKLNVNNAG